MAKIVWDQVGDRLYEAGVDHGVIYVEKDEDDEIVQGYPWNGLVSVTENRIGGEVEPLYYEGVTSINVVSNEDFQLEVEAFASPPQLRDYEGLRELAPGLIATNQRRGGRLANRFDFSYRTKVGSDVDGDLGYKLHIVYDCTVTPQARTHKTAGANAEPNLLKWTIDTVPQELTSAYVKPTSHFIIDSRATPKIIMDEIEGILYGTSVEPAVMITPTQLDTVFSWNIPYRLVLEDGAYVAYHTAPEDGRAWWMSMRPRLLDDNLPIFWIESSSAVNYEVPKVIY